MATFTTLDLPQYNRGQEVNMRFVVFENYGPQRDALNDTDGEVVATLGDDVRGVITAKFESDQEAEAFSLDVNGTLFNQEWAANENARHRYTGSP